MNEFSRFLFATPSFVEGVAHVLDIGDTLTEYNTALSAEQADTLAMWADWLAVGADIRTAVEQFSQQPTIRSQISEARLANVGER